MFVRAKTPEPLLKDAEVQVNTQCFVSNIRKSIKYKKELNTVTGIESFELLDTIVQIVNKVTNNKYENHNLTMNTTDRVIMTYIKLKQICLIVF